MVTILMAAYNGQEYLAEQIESLLRQTEQGWKLVIQDDGSSDGTFGIAREYARRYPERIRAVRRETPSGSAQGNFFSMLRFADSEYAMFCDDDDVWLPEKVRVTLAAMKRLEKACGGDVPLLVHTDLRVVGPGLKPVADSMMRRQKLDPSRSALNHLLIQNIVTGCTVMVNRPLVMLTEERGFPRHAVMHDWWLALTASALGQIAFVPQATVLYRQHAKNQVGAKDAGDLKYNFRRFSDAAGARQSLNAAYEQAGEFLTRFGPLLGGGQRRLLEEFVSIPKLKKARRLRVLNRNGFWRTGFFRKCGQLWFT